MARAIFNREFHWNRPKTGRGISQQNVGFGAYPSEKPQSFPGDFIEAAVRAGAAKKVSAKKSADKA